jgi:hypothetical protein
MRNIMVVVTFVFCIALPQSVSATQRDSHRTQLSELLQRFGIGLIAKARAAECLEEGETCASNEQCCAGLECSGGPPASCIPED